MVPRRQIQDNQGDPTERGDWKICRLDYKYCAERQRSNEELDYVAGPWAWCWTGGSELAIELA